MLDRSLEKKAEIAAAVVKAEQEIAKAKAIVKAGVKRAEKTKKIKMIEEMLKANLPDVDPLARSIETRRLLSLSLRQFTEPNNIFQSPLRAN